MELTKKQVVTICDNVIKKLKAAKENNEFIFLDVAIKSEIQQLYNLERWEIDVESFIPQFTKVNAVIMSNAIEEWNEVWWQGTKDNFDYDNRIRFMQFIKECYQN